MGNLFSSLTDSSEDTEDSTKITKNFYRVKVVARWSSSEVSRFLKLCFEKEKEKMNELFSRVRKRVEEVTAEEKEGTKKEGEGDVLFVTNSMVMEVVKTFEITGKDLDDCKVDTTRRDTKDKGDEGSQEEIIITEKNEHYELLVDRVCGKLVNQKSESENLKKKLRVGLLSRQVFMQLLDLVLLYVVCFEREIDKDKRTTLFKSMGKIEKEIVDWNVDDVLLWFDNFEYSGSDGISKGDKIVLKRAIKTKKMGGKELLEVNNFVDVFKMFDVKENVKRGLVKKFYDVLMLLKDTLENWEWEDVEKWVKCLKFLSDSDKKEIYTQVKSQKINGKQLCEVEKASKLSGMFKKVDLNNIRLLFYYLTHLKQKKIFSDMNWYTCCFKIVKCNEQGSFDSMDVDILADRDSFYDYYFSFVVDFFDCKEKEDKLAKLKEKNEKKKQIGELEFDVSRLNLQVRKKFKRIVGEFEESKYGMYMGVLHKLAGIKRNNVKNEKTGKVEKKYSINLKIIITDIFDKSEKVKRTLRRIIAPLSGFLKKSSTQYGFFHTALVVGPWYLQWHDGELTIPKDTFTSQMAVISSDIPAVSNLNTSSIKTVIHNLSDTIYKWNNYFRYSEIGDKDKRKGNCQDFLDDIVTVLGLKKENIFCGVFKKIVDRLRKTGKADPKFDPSSEFIEWWKWNFDDEKIIVKFKSHAELDTFVRKIVSKASDFVVGGRFKDEGFYLKSLDRAYWLKYQNAREHKTSTTEFKPLPAVNASSPLATGCPFKNPRETGSYGGSFV